jgi:hypothetical protein
MTKVDEYRRETGCDCMGWTGLAEEMDKWWDLVIAIMNLQVP